jgi:ribonuclease HI
MDERLYQEYPGYSYGPIVKLISTVFVKTHRSLELDAAVEALEWCRAEFGVGILVDSDGSTLAKIGSSRWGYWSSGAIYFKNQEDAFQFKLRWC